MKYEVIFTKKASKQIDKMDGSTQRLIKGWTDKNLRGTESPRLHGKPLKGSYLWRYRVGQYRILADIDDSVITIFVVEVGHRREVYR